MTELLGGSGAGRKNIGVLALQGDVREHVAALEAVGARAFPVRRLSELTQVDGLVLPGGESTTIAKLLATFDLMDPLRAAIRSGLPVYGSCAGMILLADRIENGAAGQQTLGGMDVTVRRNAFGRQVDSFEVDLDVSFPGVPAGARTSGSTPVGFKHLAEPPEPPIRTVFIRAPWIEEAGPEVEVLARIPATDTNGQPVAVGAGKIIAARQGSLLATAFHPEVTGDLRVHEYFVNKIVSGG